MDLYPHRHNLEYKEGEVSKLKARMRRQSVLNKVEIANEEVKVDGPLGPTFSPELMMEECILDLLFLTWI